jgi:predicted aspartyl protease
MLLPPFVFLLLTALLFAFSGAAVGDDFRFRIEMQEKSAATYYVAGNIQGYGPVELMVDTGSGYSTINEDTLTVLKRRQAVRYVKRLQGVLADGTELEVPVYAISRMRIGRECWLENVEAAVLPGATRQILGLSALRRAAPFIFSVDPPALTLSGCDSAEEVAEETPPGELLQAAGQPG